MSPSVRRVRLLLALPSAERRLLLRALTLLWGCRLALWTLPFRFVARWAERSRVRPGASEADGRRVARAIGVASRYVPRATCLVRALAGARLFAEQGRRVRVVIGARKGAAGLEAHAWLEAGGRVVLGRVGDLYSYHPLGRPGGL